MTEMKTFRSIPFEKLEIGMEAETHRLCVADDLFVFANASGNFNPMHIPAAEHDHDGDGTPDEAVAPSMWLASLISSVLGNQLPGPDTIYKTQSLTFLGRAEAGDDLIAKVKLLAKQEDRTATFATTVSKSDGTMLVDGVAEVIAPDHETVFQADDVPALTVRKHVHFNALLEEAEPLDAIPTAVVAPEEAKSLGGALLGAEHTLIRPILIGCVEKMNAAAAEIGASLDGFEIIDQPDHRAAAAQAVALVHENRARAVMKGHLHTDVLLSAAMKRDVGLRVGRRLSHIFVMDVPGINHLVLVTDAAINITPDLEDKVDIVQNAIDLARTLNIEVPKVGVLCAVETVNPKMEATLHAAALSKMADRGQIIGGVVDGPLAMDNAVDLDAAATKGIKSSVAGRAEILVVPNLEAGNMLAKQLTFVAHAEAGGIVLGAKCPIILTSRSDDDKARLASCAVAALYAERKPA